MQVFAKCALCVHVHQDPNDARCDSITWEPSFVTIAPTGTNEFEINYFVSIRMHTRVRNAHHTSRTAASRGWQRCVPKCQMPPHVQMHTMARGMIERNDNVECWIVYRCADGDRKDAIHSFQDTATCSHLDTRASIASRTYTHRARV